MENEVKSAETIADGNAASIDNYADVDGAVSEAEFEDTPPTDGTADAEAEPTEEAEGAKAETGPEQPKESAEQKRINAENARRRREAERQMEIKKAKEEAIIETLGGKNPYTGEAMSDTADIEEYMLMREIEKAGDDPVADYAKYAKRSLRDAERRKDEEKKKSEWFDSDKADFASKYPDVNIEELIADKSFRLFSDGKVGSVPMADIYAGFLEVVSAYEGKAKKIAKQIVANGKSSPGSLASPSPAAEVFYTREQVQKMSQEEVHRNYDKIRASMAKWKN